MIEETVCKLSSNLVLLLPQSLQHLQLGNAFACVGDAGESGQNQQNHRMIKVILQHVERARRLDPRPEEIVRANGKDDACGLDAAF